MEILGTGLTGLVGTRLVEVLSDFKFTSISRKTGADITEISTLEPSFSIFSGEYVLHMAGKTDVDACEKDKDQGEQGEAWRMNVLGARNMVSLCKKYNKKLIYVSTDFVFDGERTEGDSYTEEDTPSPINWYGQTKLEGENEVKKAGIEYIILRIAYPYGKSKAPKKDFVRIIAERLKAEQPVSGIADHIFTPTYIDDVAIAIKSLILQKQSGLFHAVGNSPITPYAAACKIAESLGIDPKVVGKTTRAEFFKDRAKRPFNLYLKNGRINNLGIKTRSFEEGLATLAKL